MKAQDPPVYSSRTITLAVLEKMGMDELRERIIKNLKDTITLIDWNEEHGIKTFRLSSEMFPHKSNPKVEEYDFDFAKDLLKQVGERARKFNMRLTFHPGQYCVV